MAQVITEVSQEDAAGGVQLRLQYSFFRARARFSLVIGVRDEQPEQPLTCEVRRRPPPPAAASNGSPDPTIRASQFVASETVPGEAMAPTESLRQAVSEICSRYSTGFGRLQAIHEDIEAFMRPVE